MHQQHERVIDAVAGVFRKCESILFVTGAGISADSGLPTYRGIGGLYELEVTEEGLPIEEILSGRTLRSAPELAWKYLARIGEAALGASYNRAHEVIAEIERRLPRVWTLTQNVDGFHGLAGSRNVIEIHGNIRTLSCMECLHRMVVEEMDDFAIPPRCPRCSEIMRPDVVLFGEQLPEHALSQLWRESAAGFDAVASVGTSSVFPYITEPVLEAKRRGVPTIEINPSETVISDLVDHRLPIGAAAALDGIWLRF